MKILVALPDNEYFLWQILVQINNFKKFGYEKDVIYLIGKTELQASSVLKSIMRSSDCKSEFYVFNDERISKGYSSSLRPYLIKTFFKMFPEKQKEVYFYIDPDVIFTKKIEFDKYLNDKFWYVSDTRSYLNSFYIKSKSKKTFTDMCKIVGISEKKVVKNDENAGGAQYVFKNTNFEFWNKVEKDSEELYRYMINFNNESTGQPIQAWTADMWAILWNAWLLNIKTKIDLDLNFSWATDRIDMWDKNSIYHNAGAVIDNDMYFLKAKYLNSPFNKEIKCSEEYCSYNYLKEIKETEKNFKKILF